MAIAIPARQPAEASASRLLSLLIRRRELLWEMTWIELQSRYGGRALGLLWAVGHPLFLIAVYVFLFGFILPARLNLQGEMEGAVVTYILAGLIPWIAYSDLMGKASSVIVQHGALVNQLMFPIEILPVSSVLVSCLSQLVMTGVLVLYLGIVEQALPLTALLLPALLAVQFLAMSGVCYVLSSVAVYVRDVKDVVQMFLSVGLFLTPILYLPTVLDGFWAPVRVALALNPFSHLVWCYQDLLYFGRIAHPASWIIVGVLSGSTLWFGYALFTKLKTGFAECV